MSDPTAAVLTDLVQRAGRGEEAALQELRRRTSNSLSYSIRKILRDPRDEEEVLQDVYMYVWRRGAEYRSDRGTPAAWLSMLARSRAIDRYRRARWDHALAELDETVRPMSPMESSRQPAEVWRHIQIRTSISELPAGERELFELAYVEGFSHSELATKTGMPLGSIKTKIRTTLRRLRTKLQAGEISSCAA
jgi:RNA polymerase sigma-70 factor, ECF subfamily